MASHNTPRRRLNEQQDIGGSSAQDNSSLQPLHKSGSDGSSDGDEDEYITVSLPALRKEIQCPICLGILRNTRTVMECLHRFCRECIDKSIRLGNNECPVCRTHCASRRALRDDPKYDAFISVLYPDIAKYEDEKLAFNGEERARNKQIQASIAQTVWRQSEALGKKCTSARATGTSAAHARRSQVNRSSKRRRNQKANEQQGSDEDSADKQVTEVNRDSLGETAELVGNCEILAWGSGDIRGSTHHSSLSAGNGENARNNRLHNLIDRFQKIVQNDVIQLILVPLDEQIIPRLQSPYLCCNPTVSIRHLCQYVGLKTDVEPKEVEILLVKGLNSEAGPTETPTVSISRLTIDPCKDELLILEEHEKLSEVQAMYPVNRRDLLFAYRKKSSASVNSI